MFLGRHKAKLVLQKAQKNTAVAAAVMQRTESLAAIAKQESLKTKDLGEKFLSKNQLLHSVEPREACNIPVGIGDIAVSVPLFKASSSPSSDGMLETNSAMADIPPVGQEQEGSKSPPLLPSNLPMEIQSKISTLEEVIFLTPFLVAFYAQVWCSLLSKSRLMASCPTRPELVMMTNL